MEHLKKIGIAAAGVAVGVFIGFAAYNYLLKNTIEKHALGQK